MHTLSFPSFNQRINEMIDIFRNQHDDEILSQIQKLIQERNWKNIEEAKQLDQLKSKLIQSQVNFDSDLIKQIEKISSFLKGGSLAQLPKDILLKILTEIDINTIEALACTQSFFNQLTKDPKILLFLLNQVNVKKRVKLAKHLGPMVKVLDLGQVQSLDKEELQSLIKACPNIVSLSLKGYVKIKYEELSFIANNLNKLQSLDLSCCYDITDEELPAITKTFNRLQSLNLSYCYCITDEGIKHIAQSLTQLQSLALSCCYCVTDEGVKNIARNLTQLQFLNLSHCYCITDEGVKAIAQSLIQIQSLDLSFCHNITNEGIKIIAQNLKKIQICDLIKYYTTRIKR